MVEKTPAEAAGEARLKRYWAYGAGSAKWKMSPTPFRTLRALLAKYVPDKELDGLTANIYHMATGMWPGRGHGGPIDMGHG
jgi:hypothetical protein